MSTADVLFEKDRIEEIGFNVLSNCVMESTDTSEDVVEGLALVVLTHLIKYDVVKHRQDTDWITSIQKLYKNKKASKLKTTGYNRINSKFDDIYKKARRAARNQLKTDYNEFTDISPVECPDHYNLDFILDKTEVDKYIRNNAYSLEVREYLGIKNKLTEKEKEAMVPKYTLRQAFPGIN